LGTGWPGLGAGGADQVHSVSAGIFCRLGGQEFDEFQSVWKELKVCLVPLNYQVVPEIMI